MVLDRPELSGFAIKSINGLGPANADLNMSEYATIDGGIFNSSRIPSRDITLSLIFMDHPTIEDARLLSYKYFPMKREVKLTIETDRRTVYCIGMVESNEPTIFGKELEGTQIAIRCSDPYFHKEAMDKVNMYGVEPLFEFPFSNESLTDPLIQFGDIPEIAAGIINYEGELETGVLITIHAIGPITGITLYKTEDRSIMRISDERFAEVMGGGISSGDTIEIDTRAGKKSMILNRGGIKTNIINALDRPIQWFTLNKGPNSFYYDATSGLEYLEFTVDYQENYSGV
jgi:hypothetical protein